MPALFKQYAFLKFHCVDEKRSSVGGNQAKKVRYRNGSIVLIKLIKLIDQLILNKGFFWSGFFPRLHIFYVAQT